MELKENLVDVKRSKFKRFKTILNVVDENPECNFNVKLNDYSRIFLNVSPRRKRI
jgi:hypothetical protein